MRWQSPEVQRELAARLFKYAVLVVLVAWPWYGDTFVLLGDANLALTYIVVALSLVLLTGWVGQISLAQASFVGIGAFVTALASRSWHFGFPVSLFVGAVAAAGAATLLGFVALRVRGLYLAVATLIFAWMCDTYLFLSPWLGGGGGAVRVESIPAGTEGAFPYFDFTNRRTFYYVGLALAALVFFALSNLRDSKTGRALFAVRGSEVAAASLGIDVTRYKLLAFGISGFIAGIAGNMIAVSQGALSPSQFRFTVSFFYLAIPVVGGLRSLSGAIAASMLFGALSNVFFRTPALNGWLEIVSAGLLMAVLLGYPGGLAAMPAGVLGRLQRLRTRAGFGEDEDSERVIYVSQEADAGDVEIAARTASLGMWALRIASAPLWAPSFLLGWVVIGGNRTRRWLATNVASLVRRIRPRRGSVSAEPECEARLVPLASLGVADIHAERDEVESADQPDRIAAHGPSDDVDDFPDWQLTDPPAAKLDKRRNRRRPVLEAETITVRFGGLTAVDSASLTVREGEIVGLIGPNGAGKTTLFNAIAGLNRPTEGSIKVFGSDATGMSVHARARLGVGRTFQAIQLLTDLTVHENLMVATHLQNPTGFLAHTVVTRSALVYEDQSRALVDRVIDLLGLGEVASRSVGGLPFGTLRMVEIARALVTRSPLVMLDEPASGLDNAETARLSRLLGHLRAEFGLSILIIEHDVHMVTGICDYIHVLNRGRIIAEGTAEEIQRHPEVIAAYLGSAPSGADEETEEHPSPTGTPAGVSA